MPWCPKCKSEYRENFTVCADCGSMLVDDEQFAKLESEKNFREPKDSVDTIADEKSIGQCKEAASAGGVYASSPMYQDSSERASENRSSAWVLMLVGSVGIVFLILGITGAIPLQFGNAYLFYGVMAAVFILFLVAGGVSMKNALVFRKKAESENSLRSTMLEWCEHNLRAGELDEQIGVDGSEQKEILFFKRFECIKAKLNYQFVNLDQGFLENFIDDCVYDTIFESSEDESA